MEFVMPLFLERGDRFRSHKSTRRRSEDAGVVTREAVTGVGPHTHLAELRAEDGVGEPQGVDTHGVEIPVLDLLRDAAEVAALPVARGLGR